ncbi:indole-3-glycerol-phosphate synthase [Candidatus Carsonella ruddii]|uniref:indole-3-glycerol-phosphate synthase n=1 Tax=Carsonella ruddii TaxID=114186 RepID=A0AAE7G415_CARRU|nr:indole-3-glycerol-phosphate synthase [Candidatus Carsonella ruddii]AGS06537.1 indole-3-glycerol phosphate synthase [Candidatus Carsonella ruddii DC]ALA96796.1 hypothetical protein AMC76_00250 [Candidatus Carsonella ruddii]QLK14018.1 hypothetical protein FK493_00240 [Candidatus Carsonella ruddii]
MNKILIKKKNYKNFFNIIIKNLNYKKNDFIKNVLFNIKNNKVSFISEYKRQSPYKGMYINNIKKIIKKYEILGSICLSLLNECIHFKCNFYDFFYIKKHTNLLILRKDFIFNILHLIHSFLIGYDVLLILSSLNLLIIKNIYIISKKLKISIIIEIHNLKELEKIQNIKPIFLGINCRNLKNLIINNKQNNLFKKLPNNCIIISESGLNLFNNIKFFIDNNIRVFLIGDYFLNNFNFFKKIFNLLN